MISHVIRVNLKKLLDDRGISIYRLAKDTNISYNALHKLAGGKAKQISFDVLDRICVALKCSAGELLEVRK
jgi:putative transcriptional regulator